uniref:C3H1-type domain-containing protein n=1 Tax=Rhabditophanes sp. KR3021 TaxID=114890 RepID=A0AC35U7U5_9BILA
MFFTQEQEFISPPSTSIFPNRPQSSLSSGSGSNDSGFFASNHSHNIDGQNLSSSNGFELDSLQGVSPIPYETEANKCLPIVQESFYGERQTIQTTGTQNNMVILNANCNFNGNIQHTGSKLADYLNPDLRAQKKIANGYQSIETTTTILEAPKKPLNQQQLVTATKAVKSESYKTVMCQAWLENKNCSFGENCRFAHGETELRPIKANQRYNNKYRTKLCDRYTNGGICPYGDRCLFIHPNANGNAYFSENKIQEISTTGQTQQQGNSGAIHIQQQQTQVNQSSPFSSDQDSIHSNIGDLVFKNDSRPPPSWPLEKASEEIKYNYNSSGFDTSLLYESTTAQFQNLFTSDNKSSASLAHMAFNEPCPASNPSSQAWKNLMYSTYKTPEEVPSIFSSKGSKDSSFMMKTGNNNMSTNNNNFLIDDTRGEGPVLNNEFFERQMAMFLDFVNY